MTEPWGISGPQFIWLYSLGLVVAVIVTIVGRRQIRSVPVRPDQQPLTVEEIAFLAGGSGRMVAAAVAGLIERNAARVGRGGNIHATGGDGGQSVLETAILKEVTRHSGRTMLQLQRKLDPHPMFERIGKSLAKRGLMFQGTRRKTLITALPVLVVGAIGVLRLINGIRLDRPVTVLLALLVVTAVVIPFVLKPVRTGPSRAGKRVLAAAATRRESVSGIPLAPIVGAAALVAVGGLMAFPDEAIAKAFGPQYAGASSSYISSDSSSYSSSSSCSSSSSSSSSSCGGGGSSCGG